MIHTSSSVSALQRQSQDSRGQRVSGDMSVSHNIKNRGHEDLTELRLPTTLLKMATMRDSPVDKGIKPKAGILLFVGLASRTSRKQWLIVCF